MSSEEAGIILTNTEGRILDCNSRCEEIAATTMEDETEGCRRAVVGAHGSCKRVVGGILNRTAQIGIQCGEFTGDVNLLSGRGTLIRARALRSQHTP